MGKKRVNLKNNNYSLVGEPMAEKGQLSKNFCFTLILLLLMLTIFLLAIEGAGYGL